MAIRLPPSDTFEERKRRNTICFKPDYSSPDIRVNVGFGLWERYAYDITENDVIIVPALFNNIFPNSKEAYDKLLNDMNYDDFCPWHGNNEIDGTHWILDDRSTSKKKSILFNKIIEKIGNYFNMDIHATRYNRSSQLVINWYNLYKLF